MSTVKMVHEIDGIFMKMIKIAQRTMTKEQLKLVFDKPNHRGNTVLFNASWTSDYITNFLITEFNISCESINLYFANPSFIFRNTVWGLLKNGCNPFVEPYIKLSVWVSTLYIYIKLV